MIEPGTILTADVLNNIVGGLTGQIIGGRGVRVRSFNGQIIVEADWKRRVRREEEVCIYEHLAFTHSGRINMLGAGSTTIYDLNNIACWFSESGGAVVSDVMAVLFFDTPQNLANYNKIGFVGWVHRVNGLTWNSLAGKQAYTCKMDIGIVTDAFNYHTVTLATLPAITVVDTINMYTDWGTAVYTPSGYPLDLPYSHNEGADTAYNRERRMIDTLFPDELVYAVTLRISNLSGIIPSGYTLDWTAQGGKNPFVRRINIP